MFVLQQFRHVKTIPAHKKNLNIGEVVFFAERLRNDLVRTQTLVFGHMVIGPVAMKQFSRKCPAKTAKEMCI